MFTKDDGYYYIDEFREKGVNAIFTDKNAGNMAYEVLNEVNRVKENREKILTNFNKKISDLFYSQQIHEDKIYVIGKNEEGKELSGYDAFITQNRNAVILTKYADCLPIYLFDEKTKSIGIAHSGWKGSLAGIAIKTISKMEKEFGAERKNMMVGIGIGMKACCYEIGLDVYDKFKKKYSEELMKRSFIIKERKIYFDNEEFNAVLFEKYGVKKENIIKSGLCTGCTGQFFSHRKEKEKSGRNAGIIFFS